MTIGALIGKEKPKEPAIAVNGIPLKAALNQERQRKIEERYLMEGNAGA